MDFALEDMDLAANEISIYDKLSETVDFVRQTGHQCGMSEKAIEKFIRQLLEKNEPRRAPPQYPLLVALCKVIGILGIILLIAYFLIQPFSPLPPRLVLSEEFSWQSVVEHVRLMSLPITRKYILGNSGVLLSADSDDRRFPEDDPWSINDDEQNETDPVPDAVPDSCTGCVLTSPMEIVSLASAPKTFERLNPLVIKTRKPLLSEELQNFLCQYPEVTEGFTEGIFAKWWRCFPHRWFPFTYPWTRALNRSHILHELFPVFTYLPFPKDTSLKNCFFFEGQHIERNKAHKMHDLFTIGSGEAMLHLIPPLQCRTHCNVLVTPVEPGDIGYADTTYWDIFILVRGVQPLVICDATVSKQ